jgi:hypothetical protein
MRGSVVIGRLPLPTALALLLCAGTVLAQQRAVIPAVEVRVEEDVYDFVSPDNGSGPLWSYGCTVIARSGDDVVVSQMETGVDVPKLCNTRWRLLRREDDGWDCFAEADGYRQREPCPLAILPGGRLYLSVNDSTQPPGTMYGACEPHLLKFTLGSEPSSPVKIAPEWAGTPSFSDHSYRGFAADSSTDHLLMFNIDNKTSVQHWCLLTADGKTVRNGTVTFPIRACYPQIALKHGAAHILAVGDIYEPVEEWREYKFEQTKRKWDYVFRILYYAWAPNVAQHDFRTPIEIANVDTTAGHITNHDLWVAPDGAAYSVYSQRDVQSALIRDRFFPDKSVVDSLYLAVVKDGAVVDRRTLIEGAAARQPGCARFHETPDGTVYLVMYVGGNQPGNVLMQVYPPKENAELIPIPFEEPFTSFCLASERAGNRPSITIDMFGNRGRGDKLCYAEIALRKEPIR